MGFAGFYSRDWKWEVGCNSDSWESRTPSLSRRNRWDETPTPGRLADSDATPAAGATPGATPAGMTWDATPKLAGLATPTPKRQRSWWDETPATIQWLVLLLLLHIPLV